MKRKVIIVIGIVFFVCFFPIIEKCKCGGTTYTSLIYRIEKANINLSGIYGYSIDIFGKEVYNSILTDSEEV